MSRFQVLVLCIAGYFANSAEDSCCDEGWRAFENSCYLFSDWQARWPEAVAHCLSIGAKLAEVDTEEENEFLKKIAKEEKVEGVWLGATDTFHQGKFVWISNNRTIGPFSNWARGEPNHFYKRREQDCLRLWIRSHYQWDDFFCHYKHPFVCEIEI